MTLIQSIMDDIVNTLVGGLTAIPAAIGKGLNDAFTAMFISGTGETQTMSVFATVLLTFGGIALALGLCKLVFHVIRSKAG